VAEPVVHDYGNIEHRDAVLAYDRAEPALDAAGKTITRWDGVTFKQHPVTGEPVPDEAAQVVQWAYVNPRPAEWPAAEFIVGNPPFIGNKRMRDALGDGYAKSLRNAWPDVPESADFVMYWWHHAAAQVRAGSARRFGFITTNSLTMIFNRRVIERHMTAKQPLHLAFAVADHPWVDGAGDADVRIAMSVAAAGAGNGTLLSITSELETGEGEIQVEFEQQAGLIHADLKVGAAVSAAKKLVSNDLISNRGVIPHGSGFTVTADEAKSLGLGSDRGLAERIRPYRNGRDLADRPRGVFVLDMHGLSEDQVRLQFPGVYQWLFERVKPDRDQNPERYRRENWWLFARKNTELRSALLGLPRYIVTGQVAKHRHFQFLDPSILPDDKLIAIATDDAAALGVLSSHVHVEWALAAGGRLGVGNDPVYSKSTCFETFPFPHEDTGLTPELTERIRQLAEQLDAHRKARQAAFESVTLTGMYNVLDKLRRHEPLLPKDKTLHEQGLVSVLMSLHDELDAAVLMAYGWGDLGAVPWSDETARAAWTETLLERLVALNAQRAAEEAAGTVRWLRPAFQDPARRAAAAAAPALQPEQTGIDGVETKAEAEARASEATAVRPELVEGLNEEDTAGLTSTGSGRSGSQAQPERGLAATTTTAQPWPPALPEQVRAVAQLLGASPAPLALAAIEASFKGKGPWKKGLPRILDTLEALGRAQRVAGGAWRG
jgi:hypothetical protein